MGLGETFGTAPKGSHICAWRGKTPLSWIAEVKSTTVSGPCLLLCANHVKYIPHQESDLLHLLPGATVSTDHLGLSGIPGVCVLNTLMKPS